ncbi:MAG TPA: M42 family metallopeptidase [Armatimonadota bacterium]|nr:M42 family metallopeptidase [Armatimonadota bacterium]
MRKQSVGFLKELLRAPSPSGYEQPAMDVVRDYVADFADEVKTDVHGNVIAAINPEGSPRVMLAGHCDQIGMIVKWINDDGYIYFASIGGIDAAVLSGLRVLVHTDSGPISGVVGRTAIHLLSAEQRGKASSIDKFWIDIGAKNKKAVEKLVTIGDAVTFDVPVTDLQQDLIASPGVDDKIGGHICMEALRLLSKDKPSCAVFAVATVQEEIGMRGATTSTYSVNPDIGIAVDVSHTTDYPGSDKKRVGDVKLGGGPVLDRGANINPALWQMLRDSAKAAKIPVQLVAAPSGTGTDANAMQLSRGGTATALIGVPNRYMHTPSEVISLKDAEQAAKLIAATVRSIDEKTDFIPK